MDSNAVDVLGAVVSLIDKDLKVVSIENDYKVFVCTTKHVTITKVVQDSLGNKYKVVDFSFDEWILLEPQNHTEVFTGNIVVSHNPLFMHGTPSSVNGEYVRIKTKRTLKKTPFIWLLETHPDDTLPPDSSIKIAFNVRLFFMDWCNEKKWSNNDHNERAVKPMRNLVEMFLDVIREDYSFKTLQGYQTRDRARFGVEVTNQGNTRKIIDEDLSGVELNIRLELYDTSICHANC